MRVARAGCAYSAQAKEVSYYEGNQDGYVHRDYNQSMPPIIYICRRLISDKTVTPPLEGTSIPLKAASDERRPEQVLRKCREDSQGFHDNQAVTTEAATQPTMDASAWIHQAQASKTARGGRTCCILPMWPCVPHRRMCTTLGSFSRDGDFNRRSIGAGGGSGDAARTSTEGAAPTNRPECD